MFEIKPKTIDEALKDDDCRQRIKLNVLMMPKVHMLLKALFKTKKLKIFKMDDQDSL